MKAILKFNLDNSEESTAYNRCYKSKDMANFLFDLHNMLCKADEYPIKAEDISSLYEKYNINIDEIV